MSEIDGNEQKLLPAVLQLAPSRKALAKRQAALNGGDAVHQPPAVGAAIEAPSDAIVDSPKFAPPEHLRIVVGYFCICFACQLMLLIPMFGFLRIPLRMMPFAISAILAMFLPDRRRIGHRAHPAMPFAVIALCIITSSLFNQLTDSLEAGAAQVCLTAAILSPLLWIGRLQIGPRGLATIIVCLWGFSAMSSGVGVLQVLFPGHLQPAVSSVTQDLEDKGITYNIELADGTQAERPYGLTDQPGGAAGAGLTTFLFGIGLLVSSKKMFMRAVYLAGMGLGLFVIYLSQIRASIVMCGVATIAFVTVMAIRGEFSRLTGAMLALTVVVSLSTAAAFFVGGSQTRDRLLTLVADDAGTVYQKNRGTFLDYTFTYVLPTYPFGAGLGRYGMMSLYFNKGASSQSLWAEIQWTAWAYDGGWLLVIAYPVAILAACWATLKIGVNRACGPVGLWGAIMTSYNLSVIAVLFSYSFFLSQSGLEFWLLNAVVFCSGQGYLRSQTSEVPEGFEVIPAPWKPKLGPAGISGEPAGPTSRRRPLQGRSLPAIVPIFDPPSSV